MTKPIASVSLDLDNKWSYLKTHGDPDWESFPSYLDLVIPRMLDFLEQRKLKITVFVVGQDAALEKNKKALAMISAAGHEIGNHSFNHEPWLHLYSPAELRSEFERSEAAIFTATGQKTVGFRGPGFSLSQETLRVLAERRYEYDCTTFPTFLGPAARAYYFFKSRLNKSQKEERKALFGKFSDGFQSLRPYRWQWDDAELLEIPVTTMPIFKTPIHLSYLHYLSSFSKGAARLYFWKAMKLCRLTGVEPSLLLHPLDFLGMDDDAELSFFPGMKLPAARKIALVGHVMESLTNHFSLVTMREHARIALERNRLRQRGIELARA
jgi:hypothetical protein